MILAAGLGTRLRRLTNGMPKALMPVGNRPMIDHHLRALAAAGVEEAIVNLHHEGDAIARYVGDGRAWGIEVAYSREERLLGTGGALARLRDRLSREALFVVVNADLLHGFDITAAVAHQAATRSPATLVVQPHPGDMSGWVGTDERGVVRRVPDMETREPLVKWAFPGLHVMTPEVLETLPDGAVGCVLRTCYARLVRSGRPPTAYAPPPAPWWDIGTPAGLLAANLHALGDAPPLVAPTASIGAGVTLGRQVAIGDGAVVGDEARLRRTVVLPGARVEPGSAHDGAIVAAA